MVDASTELLGGAAVTVFLALLFFGVVVLWDVALALRSVGDKIDKLEDNIDDDLTDIAHSLDNMSNAPRGGGGTQLHLSGGTISSGGDPNHQAQQPQHAGQQQAAGPQQAAAGQTGSPGAPGAGPQSQSEHHQQPRAAGERAGSREERPSNEHSADQDADPSDEAEGREPADETDEADEGDTEASMEEAVSEEPSASDAEPNADDEQPQHPRAEHNRGRFITSPDRTAWYATPLDRDAIDAAGPTIAGALPDGSESGIDESEIIAAGPGDSSESDSSDEEQTAATPMPGAGTETAVDEDADVDDSTEPVADDEPTDDTQADSKPDADEDHEPASDGDETTEESDEDESEVEADGTTDDGIPQSPDEIDVLEFDDEADDVPEDPSSADAEGESSPGDTDGDAGRETERKADLPDEKEAGTDVPDTVDERSETDVSALESTTDSKAAREPETETTDSESEDDGDEPAAGALSSFEFEEGQFEADEPDVTVEEAVDTMNEDAPAPELSSHRFDVRAEETDDGSAVLTLEFGAETIDITGSTERLLQYQMQSFAEKDSTPDADVTIGRDRIVIEIPDSDGGAIQQWGEAAVSIIDRTLYLSDNSDDS
ncbi:AAA family ATPase [Natrinema salsiterrestre]|uniref:AAA family ATPase n=1 Tax=Natrinema salsiterrestre TaxID=2950540 RepID=A0A9Q4Q2G7_9EURY|nr:AAA family ATPase [Natrinema salsiterrestre]MDF9746506.1 AAA family ATPase [Natrinema salsiterrestre]